jgi:hypothetical protein
MNGQNIVHLYMESLLGEKLSEKALQKLAKVNEFMLQVEEVKTRNGYPHPTASLEPNKTKLM